MEKASILGDIQSLQVRSEFFILLAIRLPKITSNFEDLLKTLGFSGAEERNRTSDLLITNRTGSSCCALYNLLKLRSFYSPHWVY